MDKLKIVLEFEKAQIPKRPDNTRAYFATRIFLEENLEFVATEIALGETSGDLIADGGIQVGTWRIE